ncbi:MAG: hypothetical protein ACTS9Y_01205 [Methylophilus sp.]|uniref:hypothetical protein n=1 Tax=Methylophilus sp. TaxID=29541 RepID=UPI003FA1005A
MQKALIYYGEGFFMRVFSVTASDAQCLVSSVSGMEKLMLELLTKGLRLYDLHALSWNDINFATGEISVWDITAIPIARVIQSSDYLFESLAEMKSLARHDYFVFCDAYGERYNLEMLKRLINRAMSIGGVVYNDIGYQDFIVVDQTVNGRAAANVVN